jgi:hypothetical protein
MNYQLNARQRGQQKYYLPDETSMISAVLCQCCLVRNGINNKQLLHEASYKQLQQSAIFFLLIGEALRRRMVRRFAQNSHS